MAAFNKGDQSSASPAWPVFGLSESLVSLGSSVGGSVILKPLSESHRVRKRFEGALRPAPHTPVLSSDLKAPGWAAVMPAKKPAEVHR